jgi:hypothetical protein
MRVHSVCGSKHPSWNGLLGADEVASLFSHIESACLRRSTIVMVIVFRKLHILPSRSSVTQAKQTAPPQATPNLLSEREERKSSAPANAACCLANESARLLNLLLLASSTVPFFFSHLAFYAGRTICERNVFSKRSALSP